MARTSGKGVRNGDSPEISLLDKSRGKGDMKRNEKPPQEEEFGLNEEEFFDIDFEWEASLIVCAWNVALGAAAFFDFLAAMLSNFNSEIDEDEFGEATSERTDEQLHNDRLIFILQWLREHGHTFGFIFSVMWFIDAFVAAHSRRMKASQKLERDSLLKSGAKEDDTDWFKSTRGIYYRAIALQLLLLPVGFYVSAYFLLRGLVREPSDEAMEIKVAHPDADEESEVFTSTANVSIVFALMRHLAIEVSQRLGGSIVRHGKRKGKKAIFKLVIHALRHPVSFSRKARRAISIFRWAKYLAPIVGTSNKLVGNLLDLLKRRKQRRDARRAQSVRMALFRKMAGEELREYAATLIQKTFRAHRARKTYLALQLFVGSKERFAALELQSKLRGVLTRTRVRLKTRKQELRALKQKEQSLRLEPGETMSVDDRRKMYQLQEELENYTDKYLNEKLLLRPNTNFAVIWKYIFVVCVCIEIFELATKPLLRKKTNPTTGEPLDFQGLLENFLVPAPVLEQAECRVEEISSDGPRFLMVITNAIRKIRRKDTSPSGPLPWYCDGSYPQLQSVYILFLKFLIHHFMFVIGATFFLDVFLSFFTGKFDEKTGVLEPVPFFQRWIAPGLTLQLLLNPQMESTSMVVSRALSGLLLRGPVRVVRWTLALFFPLLKLLIKIVFRLWKKFVAVENQNAPVLLAKASYS